MSVKNYCITIIILFPAKQCEYVPSMQSVIF